MSDATPEEFLAGREAAREDLRNEPATHADPEQLHEQHGVEYTAGYDYEWDRAPDVITVATEEEAVRLENSGRWVADSPSDISDGYKLRRVKSSGR